MSDTKRLARLLSIEESHAALQTELFAAQAEIERLKKQLLEHKEGAAYTELHAAYVERGERMKAMRIAMRETDWRQFCLYDNHLGGDARIWFDEITGEPK